MLSYNSKAIGNFSLDMTPYLSKYRYIRIELSYNTTYTHEHGYCIIDTKIPNVSYGITMPYSSSMLGLVKAYFSLARKELYINSWDKNIYYLQNIILFN